MRPSIAFGLVLFAGLGGVTLGLRAGRALGPGGAEQDIHPTPTLDVARSTPVRELATPLRERIDGGEPIAELTIELPPDPAEVESALAAWRARQAADRERRLEERQREAREWTHTRSRRFADELELPPGAELRIAEILLETDERIGRVRQDALELGSNAAGRDRLRDGVAEVRAWRDARFEEVFGSELAKQILAYEDGETTLGMSPEGPEDGDGEQD